MAFMGGIGRAWERAAKRRHQRRLEVIKAKGELRAAKANPVAQRGDYAMAAARGPSTADDAGTKAQQLERLFAAHDEVTRRWLDYELDVSKIITYPAMSDGRQPLTAAFLRAKKKADTLRPDAAKAKVSAEQLVEYREAVTDYEVAFDVAERDARRLKDSSFSPEERKRLDTAQQLLSVAIDQAATPAERQVAYRRVRQELDGLLWLSDDAVEVLEKKVALELTTTEPAAPDTAPDPVRPAKPPSWPVPARPASTPPGRVVRPKSQA
ncbi:MAG: hypothetical protein ACK5IN_00740 [Microbacterium sp.]|uniref:hypothetical protein n=1 Tax=Microbacterium sp. TaxID=51671 RepID=UPI003A8B8098